MKFYLSNPIQDFFSDPFSFPQHVHMKIDDGDVQIFDLISQNVNNFDSENSPFRQMEPPTNESSVNVEPSTTNQTQKRRKWQTIKGRDYLKQPRSRQAVMVQFKNFLVNMKGSHFRWLETDLGPIYLELVENNDFLRTLRNVKNHMAMSDYEEFYKIEEVQESLRKFFRKGHLFRELMLSKIKPEKKKKFVNKIKLLEKAFRTKELKSLKACQRQRQEIQEGNLPQGSFVRQNPNSGGEHRG